MMVNINFPEKKKQEEIRFEHQSIMARRFGFIRIVFEILAVVSAHAAAESSSTGLSTEVSPRCNMLLLSLNWFAGLSLGCGSNFGAGSIMSLGEICILVCVHRLSDWHVSEISQLVRNKLLSVPSWHLSSESFILRPKCCYYTWWRFCGNHQPSDASRMLFFSFLSFHLK